MCLIALAFARAGRGANTPVFLLTDEKVLQMVAGLGVSRRSSSRRGAPRLGLIALASARAGRGANTPAFLLTDEKARGIVAGPVVSRRSSSRRGAPRPGLIALASARAGRGANTPVFLLTDEKTPGVVAGLGVSRRSGCRWDRIVQHTSGLNHHHSPPARPESTVWPAPVRAQATRMLHCCRASRSARCCARRKAGGVRHNLALR